MAEAALMNRVEPEKASAPAFSTRVRSVDVVRGLVCVLMAIDHVRVYSGLPAGRPTPGIFLTRWVTHFVAPAFCFFAGTGGVSPRQAAQRHQCVAEIPGKPRPAARRARADPYPLPLVVQPKPHAVLARRRDLDARLVHGPPRTLRRHEAEDDRLDRRRHLVLQQVFALPPRAPGMSAIAPMWAFLYPSGAEAPLGVNVLYVIVPWIGVMMAGYGFRLFWGETRLRAIDSLSGSDWE